MKPKQLNFEDVWCELRKTVHDIMIGEWFSGIYLWIEENKHYSSTVVDSRLTFDLYRFHHSDTVSRDSWYEGYLQVYHLCVATPESLADRLYSAMDLFLSEHVDKLRIAVEEDAEQVSTPIDLFWCQLLILNTNVNCS